MSGPPALRPKQEITGRFKPGQSGNPGGRRPGGYKHFVEKLKTLEPDVFDTVVEALAQRPVTVVGIAACAFVMDRTIGKPATVVKVEGDIEIRVSDEMRKARARVAARVLEGVAAVVEEQEEAEVAELAER